MDFPAKPAETRAIGMFYINRQLSATVKNGRFLMFIFHVFQIHLAFSHFKTAADESFP